MKMKPELPATKTLEIGLELHSEMRKSFRCLEKYLQSKYKDDSQLMLQLSQLSNRISALGVHQIVNDLVMGSMEILALHKTVQSWIKMPGVRCE